MNRRLRMLFEVLFVFITLTVGGGLIAEYFDDQWNVGTRLGGAATLLWLVWWLYKKRRRATSLRDLMVSIRVIAESAKNLLNDPDAAKLQYVLLQLEKRLEELGNRAWRDEAAKILSADMLILSAKISGREYLRQAVETALRVSSQYVRDQDEKREKTVVRRLTAFFVAGLALDNFFAIFRKDKD